MLEATQHLDEASAMANVGFLPVDGDLLGLFLTFIVPSAGGCNLKCGFCIVRQRREITQTRLKPGDLERFIYEARSDAPVCALAVQGYEPLLPDSMSYTKAVLNTGRTLGIPASLVTNGQLLRTAADELAELAPAKIGISLDAASPGAHDLLRGVTGAWAAAVDGVQYARKVLPTETSLAVISVLMPSKCAELEKMPNLLRELGIGHWIVNPLHQIGRGRPGGVAGGRQRLLENLLRLQDAADRAGIRLTVDDELGCLQSEFGSAGMSGLKNIHIRTLPAGVELIRLAPSGQCSIGRDIMMQVHADTPEWRPGQTAAGDFLAGLRHSANVEYQKAA